jgi:hypothetical protein
MRQAKRDRTATYGIKHLSKSMQKAAGGLAEKVSGLLVQ